MSENRSEAARLLIHWAKTYVSHLENTGELSYGLTIRVNEAAVRCGVAIPFPEQRLGEGANARSIYVPWHDNIAGVAGSFRIVNHLGEHVPLSAENRSNIIQMLRNLIAGTESIALSQPHNVELAAPPPIVAEDLPSGNWLMPPVTLAELSKRLNDLPIEKLHTLLDQYNLRNFPATNRQSWSVRLDPPMPKSLRVKIETPSSQK